MPPDEFRRFGHEVVDWLADYWTHPERYPVMPDVPPGALVDALPSQGPEHGEPMERILRDFEQQIVPHVMHWTHPGFMGYFATSGSGPGVLAEVLAAGLNNIGLLWKTSPALTELEQVTLRWLAEWIGLPAGWFGMIHTTASEATLHAVIAAREFARDRQFGGRGPFDPSKQVVYASEHAHSSVEKAILALGLGAESCRKVAVDDKFRLVPEALEAEIRKDRDAGMHPSCLVASLGTTSTSSVDPIAACAQITARHELWLHVDAAYAGVAGILPEMRFHFEGCEQSDSFLINAHKWLFTPLDLCAFYTSRPEVFRKALSLVPEYLRSNEDPRAVNFMEYAIPLGRRFRALKLWFVLRYFGREGLSAILREHVRLAAELATRIDGHPDFERLAPTPFSLVCFRYCPRGSSGQNLDAVNEELMNEINKHGRFFLSHTRLNGRFTIRVAIGSIHTSQREIDDLWKLLIEMAGKVGTP